MECILDLLETSDLMSPSQNSLLSWPYSETIYLF